MKKTLSVFLTSIAVIGFLAYSLWVERKDTEAGTGMEVQVISEHPATTTMENNDTDGDSWALTSTTTWWFSPNTAITWEGTSPVVGFYATATSKTIDITNADAVTIMMFQVATSSPATISVEAKISADGNDFYDFIPPAINTSNASVYTDAYFLATSTLWTWTGNDGGTDNDASTSTPSFSVDLRGTEAKFMRFLFGSGATTTLRTKYVIQPSE